MKTVATRLVAATPLLLIVAVAAGVRLYHIDTQSLWLDEAYSIAQTSGDIGQVIARTATDNYPPLYNLFLWASVHIFQTNEFWARLPSAVFATLNVVAVYWFAAAFGHRKAGLVAATLLALSPFHIWYSQEARMYALFGLSSTWFAFASLRYVTAPSVARGVLVTLAGAAVLYSHTFGPLYLAAIVGGFVLAILVWRDFAAARVWRYLLLVVGAVVLFVPWAWLLIDRTRSIAAKPFGIPTPSPAWVGNSLLQVVSGGPGLLLVGLGVAFFIAVAAPRGGVADERAGASPAVPEGSLRAVGLVLASWALVPPAVAYLLSVEVTPVFLSRYFLASLPAIVLLAGLGFEKVMTTWIRATIVAAGVILLSVATVAAYSPQQRDDWRAAAQYLTAHLNPARDCLVFFKGYGVVGMNAYPWPKPVCVTYAYDMVDLVGYGSSPSKYFVVVDDVDGPRSALLDHLAGKGLNLSATASFTNVDILTFDHRSRTAPGAVADQPPATPAPAAAQPANDQSAPPAAPIFFTVTIDAWSDAYNGDPILVLRVGNNVVASAAVASHDKAVPQTLTFSVPIDAGGGPAGLDLLLTNDLYGGPGQDRNIHIKRISIGGKDVPLGQLTLAPDKYNKVDGNHLDLDTGNVPATLPRPADGWPSSN